MSRFCCINKARQNLWLPTSIILTLIPAYNIYGWLFNIGLFRIFTYLSTKSEFWMIFDESSIKAKVSKVLPLLIFRNVFSPLIPCLFFYFLFFSFFLLFLLFVSKAKSIDFWSCWPYHPLIFPKNVWHLKTMRKVFI